VTSAKRGHRIPLPGESNLEGEIPEESWEPTERRRHELEVPCKGEEEPGKQSLNPMLREED
jgi:hypothetical protein